MPITSIDKLQETHGPLLGIDPGSKTFGLALSDGTRLIATPLVTLRRKNFSTDVQRIFKLFDDNKCGGLIIGYPVDMAGTEGPSSQSVRDLVNNILKMRDVPALLWDERLSSVAVERTLLEADTTRAKRAENIDKLAAAYLLQGLLDRLRT